MIRIFLLSLCLATTMFLPNVIGQEKAGDSKLENESSPLAVVNKRMAAYNNHELDEFMSTYSEDVQVYTYPDIRVGRKGKGHIRSIFESLFKDAELNVTIHQQIVQGKYVVNEETVQQTGTTKRYVSIYEVEDGLIKSVRFLRE